MLTLFPGGAAAGATSPWRALSRRFLLFCLLSRRWRQLLAHIFVVAIVRKRVAQFPVVWLRMACTGPLGQCGRSFGLLEGMLDEPAPLSAEHCVRVPAFGFAGPHGAQVTRSHESGGERLASLRWCATLIWERKAGPGGSR